MFWCARRDRCIRGYSIDIAPIDVHLMRCRRRLMRRRGLQTVEEARISPLLYGSINSFDSRWHVRKSPSFNMTIRVQVVTSHGYWLSFQERLRRYFKLSHRPAPPPPLCNSIPKKFENQKEMYDTQFPILILWLLRRSVGELNTCSRL